MIGEAFGFAAIDGRFPDVARPREEKSLSVF